MAKISVCLGSEGSAQGAQGRSSPAAVPAARPGHSASSGTERVPNPDPLGPHTACNKHSQASAGFVSFFVLFSNGVGYYSFPGKVGWMAVVGIEAAGGTRLNLRHTGQMCLWTCGAVRIFHVRKEAITSSHPASPTPAYLCTPLPEHSSPDRPFPDRAHLLQRVFPPSLSSSHSPQ